MRLYDINAFPNLFSDIAWLGRGLPPVFNLTGCYILAMPKLFGVSQFSVIVAEANLCICMLYKAWIIYKSEFGSPFLKLLIYDRLVTDSLSGVV